MNKYVEYWVRSSELLEGHVMRICLTSAWAKLKLLRALSENLCALMVNNIHERTFCYIQMQKSLASGTWKVKQHSENLWCTIYFCTDLLWLFSLHSLNEFHNFLNSYPNSFILGDLTTDTGWISVSHSGLVAVFPFN